MAGHLSVILCHCTPADIARVVSTLRHNKVSYGNIVPRIAAEPRGERVRCRAIACTHAYTTRNAGENARVPAFLRTLDMLEA
jgi:hypothetical protein